MKKKCFLALLLLLAVILLSACAQKEVIPTIDEFQQKTLDMTEAPVITPEPVVITENTNTDSKEQGSDFYTGVEYSQASMVAQVGATPLALDPVDMPTPTPRPSLVFTYASYTTSNMPLNFTFEAPADWILDASVPGVITLTDPVARDGYQGYVTITMVTKDASYKMADMKNELNANVAALHATNFIEWKNESIENRTLVGKDGCYTTYRGVRYDNVIIRGRVHMALLDSNRVITVHLSAPGWYNESYTNVYKKIRETIKTI